MRGDRPRFRIEHTLRRLASPRARGSTPRVRQHPRHLPGFPACAGIDPAGRPPRSQRLGLPRVRGDRPSLDLDGVVTLKASPRARGSTPRALRHVADLGGFPACAGIDPWHQQSVDIDAGLPRVRGDRPWRPRRFVPPARASPRARGSTGEGDLHGGAAPGFPACAGIDPRRKASGGRRRRLPRVRGDRPRWTSRRSRVQRASPRARGSTRARGPRAARARGFPACAGIDPRAGRPTRTRRRLPRVRGDRPKRVRNTRSALMASPRARGSTRRGALSRAGARGFPACAGIDPSPTRSARRSSRLPRVRGDRPLSAAGLLRYVGASPRARGSTRSGGPRDHDPAGFPACAGIDPPPGRQRTGTDRLPRVRGDRPE
ncbi:conserved hypothetical protein [Anaeromyxobacter dehalogenans 2CP-1]|nr:conserved hypothetical protein [Anaeromyxobacter dehalogenans 2CP-1]